MWEPPVERERHGDEKAKKKKGNWELCQRQGYGSIGHREVWSHLSFEGITLPKKPWALIEKAFDCLKLKASLGHVSTRRRQALKIVWTFLECGNVTSWRSPTWSWLAWIRRWHEWEINLDWVKRRIICTTARIIYHRLSLIAFFQQDKIKILNTIVRCD